MIIFHGSEKVITNPSPSFMNSSNDYGSGFYTTLDQELAKEWACKKNRDGFANAYELESDGLKICNLNSEEYHILHWVALLTRYRGYWQKHSIAEEEKNYLQEHYLPDISGVDLVIGYRADDSYFAMVQDFVGNAISLQQLSKALRLGNLGSQLVLKSSLAFSRLRYLGNEYAASEKYYAKKIGRDLEARRSYAAIKKEEHAEDIFMLDILRGKVKEDDLRL